MKIDVNIQTPPKIEKTWGHEIWIHNDDEYCGKLLVFTKAQNRFSMHYHLRKKETWYIESGAFQFNWIDVENGNLNNRQIFKGESVLIERGLPHQLIALQDNSVVYEVSTQHFDEDSYRIYRNAPNDLVG